MNYRVQITLFWLCI